MDQRVPGKALQEAKEEYPIEEFKVEYPEAFQEVKFETQRRVPPEGE